MIKNIRKVSYRSHNKNGDAIPFIPLEGLHLKRYGFDVNDNVRVTYSSEMIHISRVLKNRFGPQPFGTPIR